MCVVGNDVIRLSFAKHISGTTAYIDLFETVRLYSILNVFIFCHFSTVFNRQLEIIQL